MGLRVIRGGAPGPIKRRTREQESILLDVFAEAVASTLTLQIKALSAAQRSALADAMERRDFDCFDVALTLTLPGIEE
jgi:hypothetical protein